MKNLNRLLGAVIAVAVIAAGAVTAIEVAAAQLGHEPLIVDWRSWDRHLRTTPWVDTRPLVITIIAIAVALLILQLVPRRPHTLEVDDSGQVRMVVRRRQLEGDLASVSQQVDGITKASVRITKKKLTVAATTSRRDAAGLDAAVIDAVNAELDRFSLDGAPPVSVRVERRN